jgi:hypothetical protein
MFLFVEIWVCRKLTPFLGSFADRLSCRQTLSIMQVFLTAFFKDETRFWTLTPFIHHVSAVYLHRAPTILTQFGFDPLLIDSKPTHIAVAVGLLSLPGVISYGVDSLNRFYHHTQQTIKPAPFLHLAYGYLPLVWSATLAHYLYLFLVEGGTLLPVTAATVGLGDLGLPRAVANPSVVGLLQGAVLAGGAGLSLALTRKLGKRPWSALWPQCATIFAFTAELWAVIV